MHPKKKQHKKKRHNQMVYGGVPVPGFPAWALWMGYGYMTGATPGAGNDTGNGGTAQNGDIEGGGDAGAGDGGVGASSGA